MLPMLSSVCHISEDASSPREYQRRIRPLSLVVQLPDLLVTCSSLYVPTQTAQVCARACHGHLCAYVCVCKRVLRGQSRDPQDVTKEGSQLSGTVAPVRITSTSKKLDNNLERAGRTEGSKPLK